MSESSPRQVLYALVAAGFMVVVAILTIAGAAGGLVPTWWSVALSAAIITAGLWTAWNWRRTAVTLLIAIGLFVAWLVGTVILAT